MLQPESRSIENDLAARFHRGEFTADQLLARYAAQMYRLTGSYEEAARRMGLDRRTVKAKVELYLEGDASSPGQLEFRKR